MNQHYDDVRRLVNYDESSDSFAKHFASHFLTNKKTGNKISKADVRNLVEAEIIWQGKAIPVTKTFGKSDCRLCMRERIAIYQAVKNEKLEESKLLINSGSEMYGACRHKPKFHRYIKPLESCADEGRTAGPEKV